jgi:hypothetical protein
MLRGVKNKESVNTAFLIALEHNTTGRKSYFWLLITLVLV